MKKLLFFWGTLLLSMTGTKVFAHDIEVENDDGVTIYYNWTNNHTELAVSYQGDKYYSYLDEYTGSVGIPEFVTYEGVTYPVTSIGEGAFSGCSSLTSITIPNSVTSISDLAFSLCSGLTSITIPSSVTNIGDLAFSLCSGLTSITIPNSVTDIGENAFSSCSGLTSITFHCKEIGPWFSSCSNIQEITIGEEVTSISNGAFKGCSGLMSVTIGNSVTSIGDGAFQGCSGLTSITIPYSVTSIGDNAFMFCSALTSITIPNSVTSIGSHAFFGCDGLTSIIIPHTVTNIGVFAFPSSVIVKVPLTDFTAFCNSEICYLIRHAGNPVVMLIDEEGKEINDVVIPEGVTSIGDYAFYECSSLTSITIGNSVTSIGYCAFLNCSGLTNITIGNSVTSIGDGAFSGCSGLTSITIGNSVTTIGSWAFSGCSGLASITIGNSVTSIAQDAFQDCEALTSITFHCYEIGEWFSNVSKRIQKITIGEEVTSIGNYAFKDFSGLTSITIGNSVTSIGEYAFEFCSSLKSVTIGSGVLSIGGSLFTFTDTPAKVIWLANTPPEGYTKATGKVNYVPNDLYTKLGNRKEYPFLSSMFEVGGIKYVPVSPSERTCDAIDCLYNDGTTDINISEKVSYQGIEMTVKQVQPFTCYQNPYIKSLNLSLAGPISQSAFQGCSALSTANINITGAVAKSAFQDCSALSSVTFAEGVTSLDDSAFRGCSSLDALIIPNTVKFMGDYALSGCPISTITIPQSVTDIKNYVFYECNSLKEVIIEDRTIILNFGSNGDTSLFSSCPLDSVYIGGNISNSPFNSNTSLRSVTITDKKTEISNGEFYGCTNLKNVSIGNGVMTFGDYAFHGCSSLDAIIIPDTVKSIGAHAFSYCPISAITIPQSVTDIKANVFHECNSLKEVIIADRTSILNLGSNGNWPLFADCPLDSVYVGGNINYDTSSEKGYSPFYRNTSLRAVTITDKETEITDNEFCGCTNLKNMSIGNGVTSFGNYAFQGCSSLDSIIIPNTVKSMGIYALSGCPISEITIPQSVTDIKDNVFDECNSLKEVIIEDRTRILHLGSNGSEPLFSSCPLDSVYIGGNINYDTSSEKGYSPFYRNTSLRSVTIKDKETEISNNEFYGCTSLKNVSIGDGVTKIGSWAFSGCSSLDFFAFGSSLKSIGQEAFSDCVSVTSIISHASTPPACGAQALEDINKWNCTLKVPIGKVQLYQAAEQWKDFFFIAEGDYFPTLYKLTYLVDGQEYKTYQLEVGTVITPEPAPEKEGYTFSGWSEIPETMPAQDVTVTGTFSINSYKLTYMIDNDVYKEVMYEYGATITPEPQPAGYYASFEWMGLPETMPSQDVTVYAVYEIGIKNYDIVDDISTYTQRTYSEVFNKADSSWYMLNSNNEYEKYGVVEQVPTKHKWYQLNTRFIKDGEEILPYKFLGFHALRISLSGTNDVSGTGQLFFNNTPEIEDKDHYYVTVGSDKASLTRIFPGKQFYKDLTTYDAKSAPFRQVDDNKYEYTFEQTMYFHSYSNEIAKSAEVEICIPDLDNIPTYQGKIAMMNDSLYLYDNGCWKTKGAYKLGWIPYTNDLSYNVLVSSIRADLSESIGFGCCWAGFKNSEGQSITISLWDKQFRVNEGAYKWIANEIKVDGTASIYQIDFEKYNVKPANNTNAEFNYAFFATQVYAENYPAEYPKKPAPEDIEDNNNDGSGVNEITTDSDSSIEVIYSLDGHKQVEMKKGLNIIRMSNGKIRKIFAK